MEIKQTIVKNVVLSGEINGRKYEVHCSPDAPLGELHDALLNIKGNIVDRILAAQKQEKEVTDFVTNKTDAIPEEQVEEPKEE